MGSIWGEEFDIPASPPKTKKVVQKVASPKKSKVVTEESVKAIKSTRLSIEEKLKIIETNVYRILGRYIENTVTIRKKQDLHTYIDEAIKSGFIAVDTETNNSLDPLTCKIMGLCLYSPSQKHAYIPINHVNLETGERLEEQLTEEAIAEELQRVNQSNVVVIMHNGKFDYEVIKCTCNVEMRLDWDTMVGAKILDENEVSAGLKQQYISKIDSSIEKYSIEHLFEGVEYAVVKPELFALYAATDAFMTYELFEWQSRQFEKPDNAKIYKLFKNIEMPIILVTAEMELTGVCIDKEYAARLSAKYHKKVDKVDKEIQEELDKYREDIAEWRLTKEANDKPAKKSGEGFGKSKSEQLQDPVAVTSPTQLAILLYDVLGVKSPDVKNPRGTGEDILKAIGLPLCDLILEKRGLEKLIGTYIDKLPASVCEKTGRLHAKFNTNGAATGRFSSSDPNLQNIPSHEKFIRLMFTAQPGYVMVGSDFSLQKVG